MSFIILFLIIYAWRNRSVLGAGFFLLTLILVEIWIDAQGLEMAALDLKTKLIWANIQYVPISFTPVTYLFLTFEIAGRDSWRRYPWLPFLLLIIPIAMNVMVWTNDYHGLVRQNVYLDTSGSFPTVKKTYGPAFWVFSAFNYFMATFTIINLVKGYKERTAIYRKQILYLTTALLLPAVANITQITGINPINVDATPVFFGFSALMISWGIFRYRLFNIIPIAHSIIIKEMLVGMLVVDNEGKIMEINPAGEKMLGLPSEKLVGQPITTRLCGIPDLISQYEQDEETAREITIERDSIRRYYEFALTHIKKANNESIGQLIQIYDITERKIAEEAILYAAMHDYLTGLPNRSSFQDLVANALAYAKRYGESLTIAFLDMDSFKATNDTYGHHIGDSLLCEVAVRLRELLRQSDIVSRYGGDEFAIAFPHVGKDEEIEAIGNKISEVLSKGFELREVSLQIKASIGFSVYPRDGDNIDVLLRKADKAMYTAKSSDTRSYCIYKE